MCRIADQGQSWPHQMHGQSRLQRKGSSPANFFDATEHGAESHVQISEESGIVQRHQAVGLIVKLTPHN